MPRSEEYNILNWNITQNPRRSRALPKGRVRLFYFLPRRTVSGRYLPVAFEKLPKAAYLTLNGQDKKIPTSEDVFFSDSSLLLRLLTNKLHKKYANNRSNMLTIWRLPVQHSSQPTNSFIKRGEISAVRKRRRTRRHMDISLCYLNLTSASETRFYYFKKRVGKPTLFYIAIFLYSSRTITLKNLTDKY